MTRCAVARHTSTSSLSEAVALGPRLGTPADLLVVGLGNPGAEYEGTRHNIGVEVVQLLANRYGGRWKLNKERALAAEVRIASGGGLEKATRPGSRGSLRGLSFLFTQRSSERDGRITEQAWST